MNQIQKLTQAIRNCAECELDYGTLRTLKMIDDESIRMKNAVVVKPTLSEVLAKMIEKGRKQNGSSILEIEIDALKSVLSEYFA